MWAFGILVYWMLSGRTPFEAATISNIFVNIETGRWSFRGDCWNGVSEEAKVMLRAQEQDMPMTCLRQLIHQQCKAEVMSWYRSCHRGQANGHHGLSCRRTASGLNHSATGPGVLSASSVYHLKVPTPDSLSCTADTHPQPAEAQPEPPAQRKGAAEAPLDLQPPVSRPPPQPGPDRPR